MKEIPDRAFINCTMLSSISNTSEVERIDEYAFYNAPLTSFSFSPNLKYIGSYAFGNTKLKHVILPEGLEIISSGVFAYCKYLVTLVIPSSVRKVGWNIYDANNLTSKKEQAAIFYYGDPKYIGSYSFPEPQVIYTRSSNMTGVKSDFYSKNKHVLITYSVDNRKCVIDKIYNVPRNLYLQDIYTKYTDGSYRICKTEFKEKVLQNNQVIETVTLPPSMESIPKEAFSGCKYLTSIPLHSGIKYVEDGAFKGCTSLTNIAPYGELVNLESVGAHAFENAGITCMDVFNNVKKFGDYAFSGSKVTNYTMSSNLSEMGQYVFANSSLKTVTWADTMKVIPLGTFMDSSLEWIAIPNNLTTIEEIAFYGCSNLKKIFIPITVTSMGMSAFVGADNVVLITNNPYVIDFAIHHNMKYERNLLYT